jgi:hypothetical protein
MGGVQPVVWDDTMDEQFTNAITNKETMSGRVIEEGIWKGVEVSWTGTLQQSARGAKLRVQYLTTNGSPLVLTRCIVENSTDSPLNLIPSLILDPGFNGEVPPIAFRARRNGEMVDFHLSQIPSLAFPDNNLVWIRNVTDFEKSEGLALLLEGDQAGAYGLGIAGMLILGTIPVRKLIFPKETCVVTSFFVVNPKTDEELIGLQRNLEYLV